MAHAVVDEEAVYACTGDPLPHDIKTIVDRFLDGTFVEAYTGV